MGIFKTIYNLFCGKSYTDVWKKFAVANKGTYNEKDDRVEIVYKGFKIEFDIHIHYTTVGGSTYEKEYTRVRSQFITTDGLKLRLLRQGFVDTIGKLFGSQDILIGDEKFDKRFVVKGNDDYKVQMVFSNKALNNLILLQNDIYLEIMQNQGIFDEKIEDGHSMIYYISTEKIKHIEQLNLLLRLYTELLDQLVKLGSAKSLSSTSLKQ